MAKLQAATLVIVEKLKIANKDFIAIHPDGMLQQEFRDMLKTHKVRWQDVIGCYIAPASTEVEQVAGFIKDTLAKKVKESAKAAASAPSAGPSLVDEFNGLLAAGMSKRAATLLLEKRYASNPV